MATATKDAVLTSAVELAREAALEMAEHPADVGEHLGTVVESDRLISHRFACTAKGYRGWAWTVTVSRVPRGRVATVCEVVLLPGDDAVLAPAWLPWSERLQPGDIGPGDVLPFRADDPRLVPGWTPTGDDELDSVAIDELALARARVLSQTGIAEAAERWYTGSRGPTSPGAIASAEACLSCGFLVPLQGSLGQLFGVCVNEWSPDDGKVVAFDHGCGAHSETDVEEHPSDWPAPAPRIDELDVEVVHLAPAADAPVQDAAVPDAAVLDDEPVDVEVPAAEPEPIDAAEPAVDEATAVGDAPDTTAAPAPTEPDPGQ